MSTIKCPIGSWHAKEIYPAVGYAPPCYEISGPDGWVGWWRCWGGENQAIREFVRWLFPDAIMSIENTICTFPKELS